MKTVWQEGCTQMCVLVPSRPPTSQRWLGDEEHHFDFGVHFVDFASFWPCVNRETTVSECVASTVLPLCIAYGHCEDLHHSAYPVRFLGWCPRLHPLTCHKSKGWSCRGDADHSVLYQCKYSYRHYDTLSVRLLVIHTVEWRERDQQDATNLMFVIKLLSQHVSGIIMPIRRTRVCTAAYGVLHW